MKRSSLAKALILVAALAISATPACRRKPKEPITPLPSAARTGGSGIENPPPDTSLAAPDTSGTQGSDLGKPTANQNIGFSGGPLDRSQYTENRTQFAASVVYFDFDSSVIKTSETSKIRTVVDFLKSNPNDAIEIEGHCDERGTEEYNRSLGERRALAVREEVAMGGIDPKRVYTISFGEDRPAVDGHNEQAWAKNRRGEFILLTPR